MTGHNAPNSNNIPAAKSSANDMTAPGSFPYPVSITLDRHGGDASEKGVYCYGLDEEHKVIESVKTWINEDRGFGGTLVHAATVPTNSGESQTDRSDDKAGVIDGGTGGCTCQWRN